MNGLSKLAEWDKEGMKAPLDVRNLIRNSPLLSLTRGMAYPTKIMRKRYGSFPYKPSYKSFIGYDMVGRRMPSALPNLGRVAA